MMKFYSLNNYDALTPALSHFRGRGRKKKALIEPSGESQPFTAGGDRIMMF
jgi:hypothetical protein